MATLTVTAESLAATVDLSAIGATDWWRTASQRKTGGSRISDMVYVGDGSAVSGTGSGPAQEFNATGPSVTAEASHYRCTSYSLNSGFSWTVGVSHLADTHIYVYVGTYSIQCQLYVSISDASSSPVTTNGAVTGEYGFGKQQFKIVARAASAGQSITITWKLIDQGGDTAESGAMYGAIAVDQQAEPLQPSGWKRLTQLIGNGFVGPSTNAAGTPFQRSGSPLIGVNLAGGVYYDQFPVFVDLIRTANEWGGNSAGLVDSEGWPTKDFSIIPQWQDDGTNTDILYCEFNGYASTITFSPGAGSAGTWQNLNGTTYDPAVAYSSGTNLTQCKFVYSTASGRLSNDYHAFSGTRKTGGSGGTTNTGITNLRLLRPGYTLSGTPKFHTAFLSYISTYYQLIRYMDWCQANNDILTTTWASRATPARHRTGYTYNSAVGNNDSQGMPIEDIVDLANTADRAMWVNIPVTATDDYVDNVAQYIKDNRNSTVVVYVEYCNELRNTITTSTGYHTRRTLAERRGFLGNSVYPTEQPPESRYIEYFSRNSNVVSVKTGKAHGAITNDYVFLAPNYLDPDNSYANWMPQGLYQVTSTPDTFTFTVAHVGPDGLPAQGSQNFTVGGVAQTYVIRSMQIRAGWIIVTTYTTHGHSTGASLVSGFTKDQNTGAGGSTTRWKPGGTFASGSGNGTTVSVVTTVEHGLSTGATISGTITFNSGANSYTYSGKSVTVTSTTAFNFALATVTASIDATSQPYLVASGATLTKVSDYSYKFPCAVQTTGYDSSSEYGHSSASSVICDTDTTGLCWDGNYDIFVMIGRAGMRRQCEIANRFRTIFGDAAMGTTVRSVYGLMASYFDAAQELAYVDAVWPQPPSYYLYGLAIASYYNMEAQNHGGANLLNGATALDAHTEQDYLDVLAITADYAQVDWQYDRFLAECAKHNIKTLMYEGGSDVYGNLGSSNNVNKNNATFDSTHQPVLEGWMTDIFANGIDGICYFHSGNQDADSNSQYGAWADKRSLAAASSSIKLLGMQAVKTANPAVSRNVAPGWIDGRARVGIYSPYAGAYPALNIADYGDSSGSTAVVFSIKYLVQASSARSYTLTIFYSSTQSSPSVQFNVLVNGSAVAGPYSAGYTIDHTTRANLSLTVTLRYGANMVEFRPVGAETSVFQLHSLEFT